MSDILGTLMGTLVTGIEDDPTEPVTRIYVNARYLHQYVLVGRDEGERLRGEWSRTQHLFIRLPDDAEVFQGAPVPESTPTLDPGERRTQP